jgi:S-adenosylmethionine-diacylglycerol 3-amino-3-carboxypropyl transferase
MPSEVSTRADFSAIRYAQCWEDADILVQALQPGPGKRLLSIASAGDNTLALLAGGPERVVALDLSPAQLACLELRVAAYRTLTHPQLLVLVGSRPGGAGERRDLYARCRGLLSPDVRAFWDALPGEIDAGIGSAGKFERYFSLFRSRVLPLVHRRARISRLLEGGLPGARARFYRQQWDTWRWRLLFRLFFSRFVLGRLGRDPAFFTYVEGSVADRILARTRYALTELDPAANPYLQWILTGRHTTALPYALRPEHFDAIRANLDRLEWHALSVEEHLATTAPRSFDGYNLSDIFEYLSPENYRHILAALVRAGRPGARLAYWNLLVPRRRPESMAAQLRPLSDLASCLFAEDKAFFYSAFVVEEVV